MHKLYKRYNFLFQTLVVNALEFRNKHATHPYLPEELIAVEFKKVKLLIYRSDFYSSIAYINDFILLPRLSVMQLRYSGLHLNLATLNVDLKGRSLSAL